MFANDKTWTPPRGVLFVRYLLAPWQNEVAIGYVDEEPRNGLAHYQELARVRDWHAESTFSGMVDTTQGEMDKTGAGGTVVRRIANRDDVMAFRKLWADRRMSFAEWVEDVCSRPDLDAGCKAMLREITSEAKAAPTDRFKAAEAHAAMLDKKAADARAAGSPSAVRYTGRAEGIREALTMLRDGGVR